ncbi:MAG: 4-(cytidine 5'-diphospho)-2-C-methyl-D-erythritol kinase [Bacteroidales bacterium]|nr:4-(cytidine 5'-diphospho)-2-C-methyl-D-erythritol kinase [Bacteroidales bacterium]MCF8389300.1 4-(cytidine 5'-diphospho)-2-C-methyl-D-erythritol kinase [Bacteroidales bacterium]
MITFPNAKINLGLSITEKREDGFHNIRTLMLPTSLLDALEFVEAKKDSFSLSGINIPGDPGENLVMKALNLVRKKYEIPQLKVHLHKNIAAGSGLGGGSSDASFMIKMLNDYFKLGMDVSEMQKIAATLGSDCSFFIKNTPQIATGRGEILEEIEFRLPSGYLYIFRPDFSISTQNAYSGIAINQNPPSIERLIRNDISDWKHSIFNEFERKIFEQFPAMKSIKSAIYQSGAIYASMSGSGSAIYGIYTEKPKINHELESILIHKQAF